MCNGPNTSKESHPKFLTVGKLITLGFFTMCLFHGDDRISSPIKSFMGHCRFQIVYEILTYSIIKSYLKNLKNMEFVRFLPGGMP